MLSSATVHAQDNAKFREREWPATLIEQALLLESETAGDGAKRPFPNPSWCEALDRYRPDLMDTLRRRLFAGRLVLGDCRWAPAEPALISGESNVRQYLLGERWHRHGLGGIVSPDALKEAVLLDPIEHAPQAMANAMERLRTGVQSVSTSARFLNRPDIKRLNRDGESALLTAEAAASLASLSGFVYPSAELDRAWKDVLFNQHHDILGGVCIAESYDYTKMLGNGAIDRAEWVTASAMRHLAARAPDSGEGYGVLVVNPLGFARSTVVAIDADGGTSRQSRYRVTRSDGREAAWQVVRTRTGDKLLIRVADVPAFGFDTYRVNRLAESEKYTPHANPEGLDTVGCKADPEGVRMENDLVRVLFDKTTGQLTSVFDKKNNREVLDGGRHGNVLEAHMEKPGENSLETLGEIVEIVPVSTREDTTITDLGPLQGRVRFTWRYGRSMVEQTAILTAGSPRIDFETTIHWNEQAKAGKPAPLLRAAFPLAKAGEAAARFSVPFGDTTRPADGKEAPALTWVAVTGPNGGAALLNDAKHGHSVSPDGVLRISLLRTLHAPEPARPLVPDVVTYSLLPLPANASSADNTRAGFDLNAPLLGRRLSEGSKVTGVTRSLPARFAPFEFTGLEGAVPTCIKQAEDDGDLILRFYEAAGADAKGSVRATFPVKGMTATNILEEPEAPATEGASLDVPLRAYEIRTVRWKR